MRLIGNAHADGRCLADASAAAAAARCRHRHVRLFVSASRDLGGEVQLVAHVFQPIAARQVERVLVVAGGGAAAAAADASQAMVRVQARFVGHLAGTEKVVAVRGEFVTGAAVWRTVVATADERVVGGRRATATMLMLLLLLLLLVVGVVLMQRNVALKVGAYRISIGSLKNVPETRRVKYV